jgi:hypothetical protein
MKYLPELSYLSAQAQRLPNDIIVSVLAALQARKVLGSGRDARYVVFDGHNEARLHSLLGFNAIEGGKAAIDDALQATLQAASRAAAHAGQLCRFLGREDLVCAYAAEGARLLEPVDVHDPHAWSALVPGLTAAAALARGFHPAFCHGDPLSDDLLSAYKSIWPGLVYSILLGPRGPEPRAREGAQAAFVLELVELVERLRSGNHRYGDEAWRLASFRNVYPDEPCDDDVPDQWVASNCIWMPWRGHDVPVFRAEIEMAGYAELAAVLRAARGKDNTYDYQRTVMGSLDAQQKDREPAKLDLLKPWQTHKVMPAVANFLERLVKIMECRLYEPASLDRLKPWQTQKMTPADADSLDRTSALMDCRLYKPRKPADMDLFERLVNTLECIPP